jgi:hypothetical protein
MTRAGLLVGALASALLAGCEQRSSVLRVEGQVTVRPEHCAWAPIDAQRPDVFDGAEGLTIREGVGVAVSFSAFGFDDGSNSERYLEGPWTMVSSDPSTVDVFSGPDNLVALVARTPGSATVTLTLLSQTASFDVPIDVVAAEDFEPMPGSSGAGGAAEGGAGGGS